MTRKKIMVIMKLFRIDICFCKEFLQSVLMTSWIMTLSCIVALPM